MKRDELFEVVEPPPFGLSRLRRALVVRQAAAVRRWVLAGAAACGLVALAAWQARPSVDASEVTRDAWAAWRGVQGQTEPARGLGETALLRLPSARPDVAVYRVAAVH